MKGGQRGQLLESSTTVFVVDNTLPIIKLCTTLHQGGGDTVLGAQGALERARSVRTIRGRSTSCLQIWSYLHLASPASTTYPFPHVNGHELALRACLIRKGLRIILLSGNPDKELTSHGMNEEHSHFLSQAVRW